MSNRRHPHAAPDRAAGTAGRPHRRLLVVLAVAQLMVILDISAVNVALPDLARDLDLGANELSWTITSYSLLFGSLLLLGGRAADVLGRRRVFLAGLGIFTAASLVSGLATGGSALFAARAGQGLGAALLSPAALSIITSAFTGHERARALGVWSAVGGAGAAAGVLLGGALTELVGWRAIFFVNLPVGLALALAARAVIPADADRPGFRGLDLRGALVATLSLGTLVYAATQAETAGWASVQTLGLAAAALAGLALFALLELRTERPLLRVQRLRDGAIGGGFVLMLLASGVMFSAFLLSSIYLQGALGAGALETGLAFLPLVAALAAGVHVAGHAIRHAGVRTPLAAGFALTAVGMLLLAGVDAGGSYVADLLPGMLVAGLGLGVVVVGVSVALLTGAEESEAGMLSGLNTTGHEVGGAVGVSVLVTIAGGGMHAPTAAGIGDAFGAAAGIAGLAALLALVILPAATVFLPRLRLAPRVAVH